MEAVEKKPVKSKKDSFNERLRAKHPDQNFDQEEDFYGRVNDDYDDYENQIAGYKKVEGELSNMFTSDPRSTNFLTNWRKGKDPVVELVRMFGTEIKDAIDDPSRLDEISEANAEYVKRVSEEKDLEGKYEANLAESLENLDKMQKEEGITDEQIDAGMQFLATIASDFIVGKISPETMKLAFNAINHDVDVATAGEEGEVRGRNAKIDEKLRKKKRSDGTATLDGKNGSAHRSGRSNLGSLDRYDDASMNIWERGGEKRRKA